MSREVDERVVQMQFDNAQFESGVKTSMGTLDKLKAALNFDGATKGIEEVQKAGKSFDLSIMGSAIEGVQLKFNALEIFAIRALSRIADRAIDTGTRLLKSLSVDQISAGWSKYEMKTNSVQTIMNSGYDLDKVNKSLEKLNWFTDETSYSYVDMVNNISKFTSSNVDLDTAITSMIGIADAAGLAGASTQDASHAMEGFSKAIAQGYMSRQNWQWIRTAHMDTTQFKQTLIDAAVEVGTLKKKTDGTYTVVGKKGKDLAVSIEDFETAMHHGWVTTKVMNTALGKFGGATEKIYEEYLKTGKLTSEIIDEQGGKLDELGLKAFKSAQVAKTFTDAVQSVKDAVSTGWMTTFEIIFGDFNEATKLWTDLANEMYAVFAEGGNARNEMLRAWKELGGRDSFINAFWNTWNGIINTIDIVKEAFRNIFPAIEASKLLEFTKKLERFTEKFSHFFNHGLEDSPIFKKGLIPEEMMNRLDEATQRGENLSKTFEGVFAVFDIVKQVFGAVGKVLGIFISNLIPAFDTFLGFTGGIGEWLVEVDDKLKESEFFDKLIDKITPGIELFGKIAKTAFETVGKALSFLLGVIKKVIEFFKPAKEAAGEFADTLGIKFEFVGKVGAFIKKVFSGLKGIYEDVKPLLSVAWNSLSKGIGGFWDAIKTGISKLDPSKGLDFANASVLVGAIKEVWGYFRKLKTSNLWTQFVTYFRDGLWDFEDIWDRARWALKDLHTDMQAWAADKHADALLKVAAAVGILAASLVVLSALDTEALGRATFAIGALMTILVLAAKYLSRFTGVGKFRPAEGFIGVLSNISGAISKAFAKSHTIQSLSKALLYIAGVVAILAFVAVQLGKVDWTQLMTGIIAVGLIMLEIAAMMWAMSYAATIDESVGFFQGTKIVKLGISLIELGIAIAIIAAAIKKIGQLKVEEFTQGFLAITTIIVELMIFAKVLETANTLMTTKNPLTAATGFALIEMAAAVLLIVEAIKRIGSIPTENLSKGMSGVTLLLVEFAAMAAILGQFSGRRLIAGATSMVIMSAALHILVSAVKRMGSLTDDEVGRGLGGLAAGLMELCIAVLFLKDAGLAAISLLGLSAGLLLLSLAMKTMSMIGYDNLVATIFALAALLTVIGVAATILAPISPALLALAGSLAILGAAIFLVGAGIALLGIGLKIFAETVSDSGVALVDGIYRILDGIVTAVGGLTGKIAKVVVELIAAILVELAEHTDEILTAIETICEVVMEHLAKVLGSLWTDVVHPVIEGLVEWEWLQLFKAIEGLLRIIGWLKEGVSGFVNMITFGEYEEMLDQEMEDYNQMVEEFRQRYIYKTGLEDGENTTGDYALGLIDAARNSIIENKGKLAEEAASAAKEATDSAEAETVNGLEVLKGKTVDELLQMLAEGKITAQMFDEVGIDIKEFIGQGMLNGGSLDKVLEMFGIDLGDGVTGAIESNEKPVYDASATMAEQVPDAVMDVLSIASPSKVMHGLGEYAIQGMINGILSMSDGLYNATQRVVDRAVKVMQDGLMRIKKMAQEGSSTAPTITPVVNLSEIQNEVSSMDETIGGQTIAMAGRINSIHSGTESLSNRISDAFDNKLQAFMDKMEQTEADKTYTFNSITELDGRQIAKSTAVYTNEELNRLNAHANRKVGIL